MRNLRSEHEIMANWRGNPSKPVVSICCITYNHEPYIEDALEGFLIQKTDFPFEILIHDDASTDRTADIIREYEALYPNIIKPIYQTVNQYSQNKGPNAEFNVPRAKGGYLALCEGDDYWTNPNKLQIQVEAMNTHPDCDISFHPALMIFEDNHKCRIIGFHSHKDRIFTTEEYLTKGRGGSMPTASLMARRELFNILPEYAYLSSAGDTVLQLFGTLKGGAVYINKTMSVYRKGVPYSYTKKSKKLNNMQKVIKNDNLTKYYMLFSDEYPQYKAKIKKVLIIQQIKLILHLLKNLDLANCKHLFYNVFKIISKSKN